MYGLARSESHNATQECKSPEAQIHPLRFMYSYASTSAFELLLWPRGT